MRLGVSAGPVGDTDRLQGPTKMSVIVTPAPAASTTRTVLEAASLRDWSAALSVCYQLTITGHRPGDAFPRDLNVRGQHFLGDQRRWWDIHC